MEIVNPAVRIVDQNNIVFSAGKKMQLLKAIFTG